MKKIELNTFTRIEISNSNLEKKPLINKFIIWFRDFLENSE
ncbi:MAG: hypothetical protein ACJAVD_000010 [Porticoccaceae bacterium]|jgi:hypothetical protein|tara:strand:- start:737 stop:859 length:123 start_codon:yes stop_codon:yes gene_type:complete